MTGTGGRKLPKDSTAALTELLKGGLAQSQIVLGVWGDGYGTPSTLDGKHWTRTEWRGGQGRTRRIALELPGITQKKPGLLKPDAWVRLPAEPDPSHAKTVAGRIAQECRPFWLG